MIELLIENECNRNDEPSLLITLHFYGVAFNILQNEMAEMDSALN